MNPLIPLVIALSRHLSLEPLLIAAEPDDRPTNFVVIFVDDLGHSDTEIAGGDPERRGERNRRERLLI
tara:strand:- start:216 stop:419 length:204 start_codon:yes stop_codon:yes gene_type:complete